MINHKYIYIEISDSYMYIVSHKYLYSEPEA